MDNKQLKVKGRTVAGRSHPKFQGTDPKIAAWMRRNSDSLPLLYARSHFTGRVANARQIETIPFVLPQPLRLAESLKYSPSSTRSHGEKDSMLLYDTANERLGHPGAVLLMILQH